MKVLRVVFAVLFAVVVLIPVFLFNSTPDSVSLIDNRKLAENPFSAEGDITENIENYINDRIGLRDSMITAYTVLNDRLFGKMVHPSYNYGKDGFVFGAGITTYNNFGEYHIAFTDMVKAIQDYCESRDVPFLFVFNPAKPAVYQDKIANGINYNREWVDLFFDELDKRSVNYLDNTQTMLELRDSETEGFNQKFDANHWNYFGAFYGTRRMLERMKEQLPSVHINELSEFSVSKTLETSLLVSNFPIHEYVPEISLNVSYENLYDTYAPEISLNPSFTGFGYFVNEDRAREGTPKALVFQGSYMNGYGCNYFINSFGEYICVHDYQNVIDFPYYFNIFQPECVIFEVAEYTFSETYFNSEAMKAINYAPALESLPSDAYKIIDAEGQDITVEEGNALTVITWNTEQDYSYVWLKLDADYDMKTVDCGYQVTIETTRYKSAGQQMELVTSNI